jgi:hypothetical protein
MYFSASAREFFEFEKIEPGQEMLEPERLSDTARPKRRGCAAMV